MKNVLIIISLACFLFSTHTVVKAQQMSKSQDILVSDNDKDSKDNDKNKKSEKVATKTTKTACCSTKDHKCDPEKCTCNGKCDPAKCTDKSKCDPAKCHGTNAAKTNATKCCSHKATPNK